MGETKETVRGKRNHRDTVFRMLFRDKTALLSLYNALNGSNYSNPEELKIVTLENAVYMNVKNDLAFLMDFYLYLCEHQSTRNPNMPLRFLQYVAREYEKLVKDENVYRRTKIMIPAPRFVVFYNGSEPLPERSLLKLSEAYAAQEAEPQLELQVQVLNLNAGNNEALKEQCRTLGEYMQYVDCVRKHAENAPIEEAVGLAVEECINRGILGEFLRENKAEVIPVSIFEYDEESTLKAIRAEEYEFGLQDGIERGIAEGVKQGVAQELERAIGILAETCAELGASRQETIVKLREKFGLAEDAAEKYLDRQWKVKEQL